jgi:hypothetical protein
VFAWLASCELCLQASFYLSSWAVVHIQRKKELILFIFLWIQQKAYIDIAQVGTIIDNSKHPW